MNIIYLDCKLLDITKRGFDFIGMSSAVGGGALFFLLCSIQMTVGGQFYSNEEQFPFLLLICNQMLQQVFLRFFSPNLILCFLIFSKITIYSLISLLSVHSIC
jgi:hypothetical protein